MADDREDEELSKPEGAKARLFGMLVREVSLVDRAANKRRFLVTKRDPAMKTNPKTAKPVAPVAKAGEQGAAETAGDAAGQAPGGGPDGAGTPAQAGSTGEKLPPMQPQVKDALLSALSSIAEKCVDLADQLKGAETDDKAPGSPAVPPSIASALTELGSMTTSLLGQYAPGDAGAAKAGDLAGVSENGGAGAQGAQKSGDGDDEMEKAFGALLAKAGKKMAKERLARFGQALNMLAAIHRELKIAKGAAPARRAPTAAAGELAEIVKGLEALTDSHAELEKKYTALATENAELKKSVRPRNGESPDSPPARPAPKAVAWPIDMNDPKAAKSAATDFAAPRGR